MKTQEKFDPHSWANGRSEVLIQPLKKTLHLKSFLPWSKHFLKKVFKPSLFFDTTRLNQIYFLVLPSKISTPTDFRLVIDYVQLPHMSKDAWTDGTINEIKFDRTNPYPYVIAPIPIKCLFPYPGLVVIWCRIINKEGTKPLDENGKEILLAQRTLSGEIGRAFNHEPLVNEGQVPIIIIDYHQKLLILLTKVLTVLTAVLTVVTLFLLFKEK